MSDIQPAAAALGGTARLLRKPNVPWKELDGVAIVLVLGSGDYFELDELGLAIWKMLDGTRSLADCAAELSSTYDAAAGVLRADVEEFAGTLLDLQLVEVVSE
ncbi:MAG: PqqD family protein [Vicinamibacterales bacterium]